MGLFGSSILGVWDGGWDLAAGRGWMAAGGFMDPGVEKAADLTTEIRATSLRKYWAGKLVI